MHEPTSVYPVGSMRSDGSLEYNNGTIKFGEETTTFRSGDDILVVAVDLRYVSKSATDVMQMFADLLADVYGYENEGGV